MFKPRLRRLDQLFTKYPVYFLTTCTDNRRSLLASTKAHDAFVAFALGAPRHHIFVGRYVIMPDHLHLFAAFADQSPSLPQWMKALKRTLAKNLARKYLSGNFWQKKLFRSRSEIGRIVWAEMAICGAESGSGQSGVRYAEMAVSRWDLSVDHQGFIGRCFHR